MTASSKLYAFGFGRAMDYPTQQNRRRWARIPLEMRVELYVGERDPKVYGRAVDLSEGGISILSVDQLKVGEKIKIAFTIPQTNQQFRFHTEVKTREGYRYGLEFLNVSATDRKELADFNRIMGILGKH